MDEDTDIHLRWNHHQTTLLSVFSSLLGNENLVDCTISAEGQHFKAHRVILSACSSYFALIFSEHSEMHPLVIIPDVKFEILKALVEFMYCGEVKVPQDKLSTVLELAETLQIKGLSSDGDNEIKDDFRPKRRNESSICDQKSFKKHRSGSRSGSQGNERYDVPSLHTLENDNSEDNDQCPLAAQKCVKSNSNSVSPKRTVEEAVLFQDVSDSDALNMFPCSSVSKTVLTSNTHLPGTLMNSDSNILDSGSYQVKVGEKRLSSENVTSTHFSSEELRTLASLGVSGGRSDADLLPQMKQEDPDDFNSSSIEEIILDDDIYENDDNDRGSALDNSSAIAGSLNMEDNFNVLGFRNVEQNRDTYVVEPAPLLTKKFKCNTCARSYRYQTGLYRHMKYECGKEPRFWCPHCPLKCFYNYTLRIHILRKHSVQ